MHLPLICSVVTAEPAPGFQPPKTTAFWLHQGEQSCRLVSTSTVQNPALHGMFRVDLALSRLMSNRQIMCVTYQCIWPLYAHTQTCLVRAAARPVCNRRRVHLPLCNQPSPQQKKTMQAQFLEMLEIFAIDFSEWSSQLPCCQPHA